MTPQCTDRDLLALESALFLGVDARTQQLVAGVNGQLEGTTFRAIGVDFAAAGVQAGMVLTTYDAARGPGEGGACEIVQVLSPTQLEVSVLRAACDAPAVAPLSAGGSFFVRTYQPQLQAVHDTLMERMRQLCQLDAVYAGSFLPSPVLRQALACGALASIFVTRAQASQAGDANWLKAEHYRREFERLSTTLRLTADADGRPEQTLSLGNVSLRRV